MENVKLDPLKWENEETDGPAVPEEVVFEDARFCGATPADFPNKEEAKRYAAWLEKNPVPPG